MNTAMMTTVLASMMFTGQSATPTWLDDYSQAKMQGSAQNKPIAVVFGSSSNGWTKVVKDAAPTDEVTRLLTDKFICCYVDTNSPQGKKLAEEFGISGNVGMVLSDRGGRLQAFWHQGDLSNPDMMRHLQRVSANQGATTTTETNRVSRTSYYPSEESGVNFMSAPSPFSASPFSPGYCPSCNNARMRR